MSSCRTHFRAWSLLLLTSLAAGRATGQTVQAREQPAFRTATDIIPVDVVVLDNKGQQVADLEAAAFSVTIDGRPRRIASARYIRYWSSAQPPAVPAANPALRESGSPRISTNQEPPGRFVMVVLDEPGMSFGEIRAALEGVRRLLATLGPRDVVGLCVLPNPGVTVPFTRDHARVLQALSRVGGAPSVYRPFGQQHVGWAEALEYRRGSMTWQAVIKRECRHCSDAACLNNCIATLEGEANMMLGAMSERLGMFSGGMRGLLSYLRTIDAPKTLVLLSSGAVADPLDNDFVPLGREASASQCSIYALFFRTGELGDASQSSVSPSRSEDTALQRAPLDVLAGQTRGSVFDTYGSATLPFDRIAVDLAGYYLLGVEPEVSDRDGRNHRINVAVPGRGVNVRARRDLVWKEAARTNRSPVDAVRAMLASPVTVNDVPMRVVSYTGPAPEGGKLRVIISAEIGRESTGPEELTVAWTLAAPNGKLAGSFSGKARLEPVGGRAGAPLSFVVTPLVESGQYGFKLAILDSRGRGGSVTHDLNAALRPAGPLAVGDLVLGVSPSGTNANANLQPPVECVVDADRLFVYWPVTSPEPRALAESRATIEITTGEEERPLLQSTTRLAGTKTDQRAVQVNVPLGLLPPGTYLARLRLETGGGTVATASREFLFAPAPPSGGAAGTPAPAPGASPFAAPGLSLGDLLQPHALAPFLDHAANAGPDLPAEVFSDARAGRLEAAARRLPADSPGPAPPFLRGLALLQRGDLEAAAQAFRDARRLSPEFADAAVFLGVCFLAGGRDEEAVGALQTARFGLDSEPMVHHLLIDARLRRRQVTPASALAEAAVKRWPEDAVFQRQLATVLAASGDAPRALIVLEAYLANHLDDQQALFLALRLLYESGAAAKGKPAASVVQRFQRYAARYDEAAGSERALVSEWLKYLTR